ncbi:polymorphic toxin type 24 domain-containing protein [Clostridium beijerinckii]|uniref:Bacterial toxin 24 domain-containing protein n=1 Tax=Clostridium beijerinckii TaxID=1520 RepID=A0AAE5LSJ0_CLOBE|nr:polymorphic toxin type 24 domain-containing protein [Clostridium beijerinckii]NSB17190.1 hypothetical protein [Clostridium beijerinckii]OOM20070.1 hypothetical protein CLOBE_50860 [Clostridium beijerinckii]
MDSFNIGNLVGGAIGAVAAVATSIAGEIAAVVSAVAATATAAVAKVNGDGQLSIEEAEELFQEIFKALVGAFILEFSSNGDSGEVDDSITGAENKELWLPPTLYNYENDSEIYSIQSQSVLVELSQKWFDAKTPEEKRKIERQLLYFRYNIPSDGYIERKADEVANDIFAGVGGQLILNSVGASEGILGDRINNLNKSEAKYVTGNYDDKTYDKIDNVDIICSRSSPEETGPPNSVDIQRDVNGNLTKYTVYGPNGELVKQVRITGKPHGNIPRPNVKEPEYNTNPKTGQKFKNGYSVRPAEPWELTPPVKPIP